MTEGTWDFMTGDRQLFPHNIGDALACAARKRWPRDTAKQCARAWDLDPSTASNLTKGHASERTITKAVKAEGWSLLMALGEALTGTSYEQHLQTLIEEADHARRQVVARREHVARLERIAAGADRLDAGEGRFPRLQRDSGEIGVGHGVGFETSANPQLDRRNGERRGAR